MRFSTVPTSLLSVVLILVCSASRWGFNGTERPATCSLTIRIASPVNCLFKPFAQLSIELFLPYFVLSSLFWMQFLPQIDDWQVIASPGCCLALHVLRAVFLKCTSFLFQGSKMYYYFFFYGLCFWWCILEFSAQPRAITRFSYVFSEQFGGLAPTARCLIMHMDVSSVRGV